MKQQRLVIGWFCTLALGSVIAAKVAAAPWDHGQPNAQARQLTRVPHRPIWSSASTQFQSVATTQAASRYVGYQESPTRWSSGKRFGVGSSPPVPRGPEGRSNLIGDDPHSGQAWRYTRAGWQLVQLTQPRRSHLIRLPPHQSAWLHPLNITVLTVLGVLALTSWASNEWDWSRLVRDP